MLKPWLTLFTLCFMINPPKILRFVGIPRQRALLSADLKRPEASCNSPGASELRAKPLRVTNCSWREMHELLNWLEKRWDRWVVAPKWYATVDIQPTIYIYIHYIHIVSPFTRIAEKADKWNATNILGYIIYIPFYTFRSVWGLRYL